MSEQDQVAKRKIIEDTRKDYFDGVMEYAPDRDCYIDGVCGQRRCEAVLNSLNQIGDELGGFEGSYLVREYAEAELNPYTCFNILNYTSDLSIAAALWILDDLHANGNLQKAKRIIPLTDEDYLPIGFYHPLYSNELIEGVVELLEDVYISDEIACSGSESEGLRQLFSLLSPERIEAACRHFTEQQLDYNERILRVKLYLLKKGAQVDMDIPDWFRNGSFDLSPEDIIELRKNRARNLQDAKHAVELQDRLETLVFYFPKYLRMERPELKKIFKGREAAEACLGFEIADPYETCFAYIWFLAKNDDAAWLFGSGCALCLTAEDMLPWYVDTENLDQEERERLDSPINFNLNGWMDREPRHKLDYIHTQFGNQNLAQIVYDLSRCVVPNGVYPFDAEKHKIIEAGMDETTAAEIIRTAEMLFLAGFREEPLYQQFLAKELPAWLEALKQDGEDEEPEQTNLEEEIQRLKRENKALKSALAESAKESEKALKDAERELKSLRMEHRELADLRERIFTQGNELGEEKEVKGEEISWPYETKKKMVLFGGHFIFQNSIRAMLPTVKFVKVSQYSFDPNIIKYADMVWIQTNYLAHPQYWNVVRIAKQYGVQLRYFAYASAEKCALQVVEEDNKP